MSLKRSLIFLLAFVFIGWLEGLVQGATTSSTIQWSAYLKDSAGTVLNGAISITFNIYSASTGGTTLWTETKTVTCDNGFCSASLGSDTAFGTLFSNNPDLYLGITVDGDTSELGPRPSLASCPVAQSALTLGSSASLSATNLASSAVTTAKIADSNVTTAKIADANVTAAKIADSAITAAKVGTGAVTTTGILDETIAAADMAAGAVTTAKIATDAVDGTKISLTGEASGNLAYFDGTNWVRLANGTAGQVLQTGTPPTWVTPAAAGMPSPLDKWVGWINGGVTNFDSVGMNLTLTGDSFQNSNDAVTSYTRINTSAVSGNAALLASSAFSQTRLDHNPTMQFVVKIPTITSVRVWIGLTSVAFTDADAITPSHIGWRFSTVAADGNWKVSRSDNTTQTVTDTGLIVAADTQYRMKIVVSADGTSAKLTINGGSSVTVTTGLPPATGSQGWEARVITQAAAARNLDIAQVYLEQDNQ